MIIQILFLMDYKIIFVILQNLQPKKTLMLLNNLQNKHGCSRPRLDMKKYFGMNRWITNDQIDPDLLMLYLPSEQILQIGMLRLSVLICLLKSRYFLFIQIIFRFSEKIFPIM